MQYLESTARMPVAVWLGDGRIDCTVDSADSPEPLGTLTTCEGWVELTVPVEVGEGETDRCGNPFTKTLTIRFPQWLMPHQAVPAPPGIDTGYELICRRTGPASAATGHPEGG